MIVDWFMGLAMQMTTWVLGQTPDLSPASQFVFTATDALGPILAGAAGLGAWIPWGHLGSLIAAVLGFYLLTFAFKVVRQLLAHVPAIGGSG